MKLEMSVFEFEIMDKSKNAFETTRIVLLLYLMVLRQFREQREHAILSIKSLVINCQETCGNSGIQRRSWHDMC
jgi:hypothetical protein